MRKTFTILFASTALTALFGIPAGSAMENALRIGGPGAATSPVLVGDDEDGGRDHKRYLRRGENDDDEDDEDDDDDSNRSRRGAQDPAPAGSANPPQNGLFGDGAAPKVKVN